jgi:hypothetical protein
LKKSGKLEGNILEALENAGEKEKLLVQSAELINQIGDATI